MFLDELAHPRLDRTVQLCTLARRARVLRERIREVREAVQHEHGAVPRGYSAGGGRAPTQHRVLFLRGTHAHPYRRVNECVQSALDRCAISAAAVRLVVIVAIDFGGV